MAETVKRIFLLPPQSHEVAASDVIITCPIHVQGKRRASRFPMANLLSVEEQRGYSGGFSEARAGMIRRVCLTLGQYSRPACMQGTAGSSDVPCAQRRA